MEIPIEIISPTKKNLNKKHAQQSMVLIPGPRNQRKSTDHSHKNFMFKSAADIIIEAPVLDKTSDYKRPIQFYIEI